MKKFLLVFGLSLLLAVNSFAGETDPVYKITGPTLVHPGDIDMYTLTPVDGINYNWTVTGGIIISGQGTPNIRVNWIDPIQHSMNVRITEPDNSIVIIDEGSF